MKTFAKTLPFAIVLSLFQFSSINLAFADTTYTFTNASATGYAGPTQAQVTTAYSGTNLAGNVTINNQGIQEWTVPSSGKYRINVKGAAGSLVTGYSTTGFGANISGEFDLTGGTVLKIVVGQQGIPTNASDYGGGGGGGSFVVNGATLLIAAGGGGSHGTGGGYGGVASYVRTYADASLTTTAKDGSTYVEAGGAGGTSGGAGGTSASSWNGHPGAGFSGSAASGGAKNWATGMTGGTISTYGYGGFGGGGSGGMYGGSGGGGYSGGGANSRHGPGGGGASYNTGANTSAALLTTFGHGSVVITSLGPSLTTFAPRATLQNTSTITYDITFSENVTGLATSDFGIGGTGGSTCLIGLTGSNTTYVVTLTSCSAGTVTMYMVQNAVQNAVLQYAPATNTYASTVTIDQTAPTISSVTGPANATYKPADTPTFTLNFSESVTITGTPRLTLTVGSSIEYANYVSMTDSKTALFRYTVATDPIEFDTDGIAVSTSVDLNSGTIRDLATNAIAVLTFSAPSLTSVLVAQPAAAPSIDSITAGNQSLAVYFSPGSARGSTPSNYQYSTDNGITWTTRTPTALTSPLSISGLTNGTGYRIRLRAITNAGNSDSSSAVIETPTVITVSGDSTLTLTFGTNRSTSPYSASGGNNSFTWSLGSTISGVTLSGTSVTADSSLNVGTYTQTVRALDTSTQVGIKNLTITVNKASSSLALALQGGGSTIPLGQSPVFNITTDQAGTVVFSTGGQVITACASVSVAVTTATCTLPSPGVLTSITLSAVFTPNSGNYETSSTTISISIVDGVSTISISLAGGVTQTPKGQNIVITATIDQVGKVTFTVDGKNIPGCINLSASVGNKTCTWKPAVQKQVLVTAKLNPTNTNYKASSSSLSVWVIRRTGTR